MPARILIIPTFLSTIIAEYYPIPDAETISDLQCSNHNEWHWFLWASKEKRLLVCKSRICANYIVWDGISIANSQESVQGFPL
jgi:hypothetical protein